MPAASHRFSDDGRIPNHPDLPLLVYAGALAIGAADRAAAFEALFRRHGWGGMWRNGIYAFHHYHSTAPEVLGIAAGRARILAEFSIDAMVDGNLAIYRHVLETLRK